GALLKCGSTATEAHRWGIAEKLLGNRSRSAAFQGIVRASLRRLVWASAAALAHVRVLRGGRCVLNRCCRDVAGGHAGLTGKRHDRSMRLSVQVDPDGPVVGFDA